MNSIIFQHDCIVWLGSTETDWIEGFVFLLLAFIKKPGGIWLTFFVVDFCDAFRKTTGSKHISFSSLESWMSFWTSVFFKEKMPACSFRVFPLIQNGHRVFKHSSGLHWKAFATGLRQSDWWLGRLESLVGWVATIIYYSLPFNIQRGLSVIYHHYLPNVNVPFRIFSVTV